MKPGCHSFDAGLSGITPGHGQAGPYRHAVAGGVGEDQQQLLHVDPGADRHGGRLGRRRHLRRVDHLVAQLDDLAHARAADVHHQPGEGIDRRLHVGQRVGVAADHQRQRPLLRAGRTARERRVEVARPGRRHPGVLGPLHLGIDGGACR